MREIPIFRQISLDLERSGRELQIWSAAVELLDLVEPRVMTITALETHLLRQQQGIHGKAAGSISRSTIAHALTRLEQAGYLYREVGDDQRERFRIPLSRRPSAVETPADVVETRPRARQRLTGVVSEAIA